MYAQLYLMLGAFIAVFIFEKKKFNFSSDFWLTSLAWKIIAAKIEQIFIAFIHLLFPMSKIYD